jgi:hypothetical protein
LRKAKLLISSLPRPRVNKVDGATLETVNPPFRQNFDEVLPDALMNDLCGIGATRFCDAKDVAMEQYRQGLWHTMESSSRRWLVDT